MRLYRVIYFLGPDDKATATESSDSRYSCAGLAGCLEERYANNKSINKNESIIKIIELLSMDRHTRKLLTMHRALQSKAHVDPLYIPRRERVKALSQL